MKRNSKDNYKDFDGNIHDGMKNCDEIYNECLMDSNDLLDEMKEYYWNLYYDRFYYFF